MVVYSNSPVRVNITWEELVNKCYRAPKGIDTTFVRDTDYKEGDVWFVQMVASDIFPYDEQQERYREDIEKQLSILNVTQDHIREHFPYTKFPQKKRVVETVLDDKIFGKDNRYDVLLDKITSKHVLKDGRIFGTIEDS